MFWKNYFYRISLIKQSAQLTALAAQQAAEWSEEKGTSAGSQLHHSQGTAVLSITVGQNVVFSGKEMNFHLHCHLCGTCFCRATLSSGAIVECKCNTILLVVMKLSDLKKWTSMYN